MGASVIIESFFFYFCNRFASSKVNFRVQMVQIKLPLLHLCVLIVNAIRAREFGNPLPISEFF